MKSLFKKFSTAVIVLAAVALLSVPLLGGARLAADCGRIEKKFNHFAAETDKHGNNFESDMVVFAANAESLCDEAARITGEDSPAVRSLQNDLAEYEKCGSAFEKFDCFKRLLADAKRVYASVPEGSVTDSLMTAMDGLESADSRLSRTYGAKYSECMKSRSDLLSGGLSSAIAKIYGIGGK